MRELSARFACDQVSSALFQLHRVHQSQNITHGDSAARFLQQQSESNAVIVHFCHTLSFSSGSSRISQLQRYHLVRFKSAHISLGYIPIKHVFFFFWSTFGDQSVQPPTFSTLVKTVKHPKAFFSAPKSNRALTSSACFLVTSWRSLCRNLPQ